LPTPSPSTLWDYQGPTILKITLPLVIFSIPLFFSKRICMMVLKGWKPNVEKSNLIWYKVIWNKGLLRYSCESLLEDAYKNSKILDNNYNKLLSDEPKMVLEESYIDASTTQNFEMVRNPQILTEENNLKAKNVVTTHLCIDACTDSRYIQLRAQEFERFGKDLTGSHGFLSRLQRYCRRWS
jgi:hypothetical protein